MSATEAPIDPAAAANTHAFQADVAKLLHLMVHSVYSDRDIFLRELISNAADACEKLRYEALDRPDLIADGAPFLITISPDKESGTLCVADNGVGMDRRDLVDALGTIASSGTKAFLERINSQSLPEGEHEGGKGGAAADLIGQFGIGFYSAFMVADRIDVETRRAGEDRAWLWSSDGKGSFTIAPLPLEGAPVRGTRVKLHLNEASKDFLESWKIESVVREHSGAVAVPIELREASSEEPRPLSEGAAIWAKPKSAVSTEEYAEFYRGLAGQFDEPALTVHWRAEGRHEYTVLAFVPGSRPLDLFDPARTGHAKLYVRRVLITRDCAVVPGWMRFVRLVVDSADLPLNVSREMIQESAVFAAIKRGVTNRLLQELVKTAESDSPAWAKIWSNFGPVLKEGLYEAPELRDHIFKLVRFATSKHLDGERSLQNYIDDLRPNQTAIYYLAGDDAKRLAASPQLEGYRARGIEVLLLPDPVDAFWTSTSVGYEGKPFKSVTQGAADIKAVPLLEGEAESGGEQTPQIATFFAFMKQTLASVVEDVRPSDRLASSAACIVAPEKGPDRRLERMLAEHGRLGAEISKPVLEVNPTHPLIEALAKRFEEGGSREFVEDAAWLIHDEARLMDSETIADPGAFAARLARVLTRAAG
ncbi:MAG TPA: molecular chaperone HtpG [Beijerinckiaceae bacterium]|nr:molecular chaperone HtpG [Beijerinckiaceae bacterium]